MAGKSGVCVSGDYEKLAAYASVCLGGIDYVESHPHSARKSATHRAPLSAYYWPSMLSVLEMEKSRPVVIESPLAKKKQLELLYFESERSVCRIV